MIRRWLTKNSAFAIPVAVGIIALVPRLLGIMLNSIWGDEAFSFFIAKFSLVEIWAKASLDVHPPLYYGFLHFWMVVFGGSEIMLRLLSVFIGVASVVVGYYLLRLIADKKTAFIASVVVALNPFLIYYSWQVRMYSLLLLLSIVSIYLVLKIAQLLRKAEISKPTLLFAISYVLIAALAFYTHYYFFLIFLLEIGYLLYETVKTRSRDNLQILAMMFFLPIILYLPWLQTMLMQFTRRTGLEWLPKTSFNTLPNAILEYFTTITPHGILATLTLWLGVFGLIYVLIKGYKKDYLLLHLLIWIPLALALVVSVFIPVFHERYLIVVAFLLPAVVVLSILNLRNSLLRVGCLLIVVASICVGDAKIFLKHQTTSHDISQTVIGGRLEGDRVATVGVFYVLPIQYYLPSSGCVVVNSQASSNSELEYAKIFPEHYNCLTLDESIKGRIWVITPSAQIDAIKSKVPPSYILIKEQIFRDKRLLLYVNN